MRRQRTRPNPISRRATAITGSLLLVGGLALGGCAPDASDSAQPAATTTQSGEVAETSDDSATDTASDRTPSSTTAATISSTSEAAQAFLDTLSEEQRDQVLADYDDETKTVSWSNFPVTFVERAGLNLDDLTEEQQAAAMEVLEALLSEEGYTTVTDIIGGDEFLLENSTSTEDSLGQYYIAFFGDPSGTSAWELQFGGHHLGINATLDGTSDAITFAPTHLGSQPAVYTDADGNEVQPLAGMYETAFAFYDSLTEEQLAAMYQGEEVSDLVCAPGGTCDYPTGTGLSGADLTDEQKQLLLDVAANWVGLSDEETTADALAEIEATLDETYISWSGATTYDMSQGSGISFQISGPDVYIELSDQQGSAGADVDGYTTAGWGHIHTIYRDPSNDYAGSVTQAAGGGVGGPGR
jgi:L-lactate utilization protein LutC